MTIDEYLRELREHLRVSAFVRRRIVRELEAHIHDATRAAREDAERTAIARLGPAPDVAALFPSGRGRRWWARSAGAGLAAVGALVLALELSAGGHLPIRILRGFNDGHLACHAGCRVIYDSARVNPHTPCLQRYLSSPTHLSAFEIGKAKSIRAARGSLFLNYGHVELVVPCGGVGSALSPPARVMGYLVRRQGRTSLLTTTSTLAVNGVTVSGGTSMEVVRG